MHMLLGANEVHALYDMYNHIMNPEHVYLLMTRVTSLMWHVHWKKKVEPKSLHIV